MSDADALREAVGDHVGVPVAAGDRDGVRVGVGVGESGGPPPAVTPCEGCTAVARRRAASAVDSLSVILCRAVRGRTEQ